MKNIILNFTSYLLILNFLASPMAQASSSQSRENWIDQHEWTGLEQLFSMDELRDYLNIFRLETPNFGAIIQGKAVIEEPGKVDHIKNIESLLEQLKEFSEQDLRMLISGNFNHPDLNPKALTIFKKLGKEILFISIIGLQKDLSAIHHNVLHDRNGLIHRDLRRFIGGNISTGNPYGNTILHPEQKLPKTQEVFAVETAGLAEDLDRRYRSFYRNLHPFPNYEGATPFDPHFPFRPYLFLSAFLAAITVMGNYIDFNMTSSAIVLSVEQVSTLELIKAYMLTTLTYYVAVMIPTVQAAIWAPTAFSFLLFAGPISLLNLPNPVALKDKKDSFTPSNYSLALTNLNTVLQDADTQTEDVTSAYNELISMMLKQLQKNNFLPKIKSTQISNCDFADLFLNDLK